MVVIVHGRFGLQGVHVKSFQRYQGHATLRTLLRSGEPSTSQQLSIVRASLSSILAPWTTIIHSDLVDPVVVQDDEPAPSALRIDAVLAWRVAKLYPQPKRLQRGAQEAKAIPSLTARVKPCGRIRKKG
jgi:hypothetical protein